MMSLVAAQRALRPGLLRSALAAMALSSGLLAGPALALDDDEPTITMTAPTNGASYPVGSGIVLTASAWDDVAVVNVKFYVNNSLVNTDNTAPYSYTYTPSTAGSYAFTAVVSDGHPSHNALSEAVNVTVVAGNAAPSVSLTSPSNGATATAPGSFTLSATASDSDGTIASVKFYSGATLLDTDTGAPYSYSWTGVAAGSYAITAVATDDDGATTTSSTANVTVTAGNAAPSVSLTSPSNGATAAAPGSFTLSATASDSDGTIASVKFYNGATLLNTDSTTPYSYSWTSVAAGTYAITAVATDDDGATTTSAASNVTVSGGSGGISITLTAPSNGTSYTLGSSIGLTATVAGGSVNRVRFKQNGTNVSTGDTSAPYSDTFTPAATGTFVLTAEAVVTGNVVATSSPVTVTVTSGGGGGGGTVSALRTYVYDANERLCKVIEPERGATIIEYDGASNILWTAEGTSYTSTTDCQRGSVQAAEKVTRTYDDMGRVTAVATPGGTADVVTTYYADGAVNTLAAANPSGNTVTTTYTYNKRRLLTGESSAIVGPQGHAAINLGYVYNTNGHLKSLVYPDGETVNYAPDALGRASQVITAGGTTYASGIGYHASGAISKFAYGNGILHRMTQNARKLPGRSEDYYCAPSDPTYPACSGSITRTLDDSYTFDKNGNVTDIVDGAQAGKTTRGMGYDNLDRLTAAVAPDPSMWGNATFAYDALDNLRSMDVGTNRQYRYNYDANNRLLNIKNPGGATQFAFTYDARGNTTAKGSQAFVFDYGNRLNAVTGSQTYSYDGQGRRVLTLDADGKKTYWIYSQSGQVLYTEEARRRQNLSYIYLGNTQVATRAWNWDTLESTIRYQHADSLGSIVAETATDRSVVKRNTYEPYGDAWNSTIDGTGYTGHVMDQATGLTYMQQRYYDPQIGRFLSIDPVDAGSGDGTNFNRYWYADSNPYNNIDPDGRQSMGAWGYFGMAAELYANDDYVRTQYSRGKIDGPTAIYMMDQLGVPSRQFKEQVRNDLRADAKGLENARNRGIDRAWSDEKRMVRETGAGTRAWTAAQKDELLASGRVKGFDGHHSNNVRDFPEQAADPSNVVFLSKAEHLRAHNGNFQNRTTGHPVVRASKFVRFIQIGSRLVRTIKLPPPKPR